MKTSSPFNSINLAQTSNTYAGIQSHFYIPLCTAFSQRLFITVTIVMINRTTHPDD